MKFKVEDAFKYIEKGETYKGAVALYCKENNLEHLKKYDKRLSRYDKALKKVTPQLIQTTPIPQVQEEFFSMPSAWSNELGRFYSIEEYCEKFNLDYERLERYNLVAHIAGHMVFNVRFKQAYKDIEGIDEDFLHNLVNSLIKPIEYKPHPITKVNTFDRLIITDVHIGMCTDGGRNTKPLYTEKWDKEELFNRLEEVVKHTKTHGQGGLLVIDELGDFVDGLNMQTTRGGHSLPQNMTDKEVFENAVKFKVTLIDNLVSSYNEIICNSVTEDNHGGVFSYFVNSTVKKIVEAKYSNVSYNILERFIEHYSVGKHTFKLTHGKDSKDMKFGLKPLLDTKIIEKIDQYCKENNLYNGNFLELSKGDNHQMILDYTTSSDFDYFCYPAFSPASNWVKLNFGKSRSGFVLQVVDYNRNIKKIIPRFFN